MNKDLIKIYHRKPGQELKPFIRKISVFESHDNISFTQKLTPSPYNYISYNQNTIPVSVFPERRMKPDSRLMFAGIKTKDIYVVYKGKLKQLLIEFTAQGFYYLFHCTPVKYINKLILPDQFFSSEETALLIKKLGLANDIEDQIEIIENFLLTKTDKASKPIDYLDQCIKLIEENRGCLTIKELSLKIGICERQLNRRFTEVVGIPPKKYSRIFQLHYIIYLIYNKKIPIQEIVFKSLFYDRPHFNHSFKELTGMTLSEFINTNKHIAFEYFAPLP